MNTFYSWECPPRKLIEGRVLDFEVNTDDIFMGQKCDLFTELPKIVEFVNIEKTFFNFNFSYYKIIADTNAYYLSPESISLNGEDRLRDIFVNFKDRIQKLSDSIYGVGKVKVLLFTELISEYRTEYNELFLEVLNKIEDYYSVDEFEKIKQYLISHVGFNEGENLVLFTQKVIASYIVEGMIIPKVLNNPIWINFDEPEILANMTNRIINKIQIIKPEDMIKYISLDARRNKNGIAIS